MASQAELARADSTGKSDSNILAARLRQLSELELLPNRNRVLLAEAADKLASGTVYVAVVGDFKRGKSSLINALLGAPLLPVGVVPLTAHPTLVRYGPVPAVLVTRASGTERVALERLAEFVTEHANPGNRLGVREVWVEFPSPLLGEGVVVVDTPGTGSFYEHNTDAARSFLPRIDVGVVVLTTESPLSLSEARWMRDVAGRATRIAVCINKVDTISALEQAEVLDFVRVGVARVVGDRPTPFFMTSARRELEEGTDEGVASLRDWLVHDLGHSRSSIASDSAVRAGTSALDMARSALAVARAALASPVADARDREQRVLAAQMHLSSVGNEGRAVISAHAADLIGSAVDPRVDAFRAELSGRLRALSDDQDWPQAMEATVSHTGQELEALVREPLQTALLHHADRLQGVLREFLAEVGEIYQIKLPGAPLLADPSRLPRVRVAIDDEPGALAMGLRTVRRVLPGSAGRTWRERARRQDADQAADRLAGRLRYATVSAVDEAVREWLAWSDAEWQGIAEALSAALRRSGAAAAAGEAAAKSEEIRMEGLDAILALVAEALRPNAVTPG